MKIVYMDFQEIKDKFNEFTNSIVEWFKNLPDNLKKLAEKIKNIPLDEQISWGSISLGCVFLVIGIIVW